LVGGCDQEDLNQAASLEPFRKYEDQGGLGVRGAADLIRRFCGAADVARFADAVIFNHLTRGSDAHARNHAILIAADAPPTLAPLFDLNATLPHGEAWAQNAAMAVGGQHAFDRVGRSHWLRFAADTGLPEDHVLERLRSLAERLPTRSATPAGPLGPARPSVGRPEPPASEAQRPRTLSRRRGSTSARPTLLEVGLRVGAPAQSVRATWRIFLA
jgi:serine/threonine-protein kinase HipA